MKKIIISLTVIALFLISMFPVFAIEVTKPSLVTEPDEDSISVSPDEFGVQSVISTRSSLEKCAEFRQSKIDDGKACVGDCILIEQYIFNCESKSDRAGDIDPDEVGRYGFFWDNDDSCPDILDRSEGIQDDFDDYKCMYDATYIPNPCETECSLDNTEIRGDGCYVCITGTVCNEFSPANPETCEIAGGCEVDKYYCSDDINKAWYGQCKIATNEVEGIGWCVSDSCAMEKGSSPTAVCGEDPEVILDPDKCIKGKYYCNEDEANAWYGVCVDKFPVTGISYCKLNECVKPVGDTLVEICGQGEVIYSPPSEVGRAGKQITLTKDEFDIATPIAILASSCDFGSECSAKAGYTVRCESTDDIKDKVKKAFELEGSEWCKVGVADISIGGVLKAVGYIFGSGYWCKTQVSPLGTCRATVPDGDGGIDFGALGNIGENVADFLGITGENKEIWGWIIALVGALFLIMIIQKIMNPTKK